MPPKPKNSGAKPLKASTSLPFLYRLTLLLLEPLFALNGAIMTFRTPRDFATQITHDPARYTPANQFLYTQLGGAWLLFAFNEAVVMSLVDDLRVWRLLCWGMLVSDVVYHVRHSFDWAVFASAVGPMVVRLLIVAGVGVRKGKGKGRRE